MNGLANIAFAVSLAAVSVAGTVAYMTPLATHDDERPAIKTVVLYSGVVDAKSAQHFMDTIYQNEDAVIGLQLGVVKSDPSNDRYFVIVDDGKLNIAVGDPMNAPQEVLINGGLGSSHDLYLVDGFYLIKNGGQHAAGALSVGAMPVDEATLRLNPYIRIVKKSF
jgi:hypothetical protein